MNNVVFQLMPIYFLCDIHLNSEVTAGPGTAVLFLLCDLELARFPMLLITLCYVSQIE